MILWIFSFLMMNGQLAAADEVVDRIVAVVNDEIITYLELQKELKPYEDKIRAANYSPDNEEKMLFKTRNEILNRMIDDKLTDQEAKKNNIKISEEEIDATIEQIKAANMWTDEILREAIEREGMTMEAYRESLRKNGMRTKLVNNVVKSKIVITKEDVRAYYDDHADEYAGEIKYHLRNIYVMVPETAKDDDKQKILRHMNTIYDELKEGASFQALAESFSNSSAALNSGDLGFVAFKDISPKLQEVVKYLAVGEFTPVVEMGRAYQIFYVEDIARIGARTFEQARSEIERKLYNELVDDRFKTWLEDLRKNAHIKIIL